MAAVIDLAKEHDAILFGPFPRFVAVPDRIATPDLAVGYELQFHDASLTSQLEISGEIERWPHTFRRRRSQIRPLKSIAIVIKNGAHVGEASLTGRCETAMADWHRRCGRASRPRAGGGNDGCAGTGGAGQQRRALLRHNRPQYPINAGGAIGRLQAGVGGCIHAAPLPGGARRDVGLAQPSPITTPPKPCAVPVSRCCSARFMARRNISIGCAPVK